MTDLKRQSKGDPTRVCDRESRQAGMYRVSDVTEAKQDERAMEREHRVSLLSAGALPEHFVR